MAFSPDSPRDDGDDEFWIISDGEVLDNSDDDPDFDPRALSSKAKITYDACCFQRPKKNTEGSKATATKNENWSEESTLAMYEFATTHKDVLHPPPGSPYFKKNHPDKKKVMAKVLGK